MNLEAKRITRLLVGAIMSSGFVWLVFNRMSLWWALAVTFVMAYEAWTIANNYVEDTISEIVRYFSRRQLLVPWLFGFTYGAAIFTGKLTDIVVIAALGVLQGHFFFSFAAEERYPPPPPPPSLPLTPPTP